MNSTNQLWQEFEQALTEMCGAYAAGRFTPLLEADIAGFLYHLFLRRTTGDASQLHLDTRLFGAADNDKFDFVVGPVLTSADRQSALVEAIAASGSESHRKIAASKPFGAQLRPMISAELVVEFKLLAPGFSPQQNREHLRQVHEDIRRLFTLAARYPDRRGVLVVDTQGYVNQNRQEEIVRTRDRDHKLCLYLADLSPTKSSNWRNLVPVEA